jgi:hypothetical protein
MGCKHDQRGFRLWLLANLLPPIAGLATAQTVQPKPFADRRSQQTLPVLEKATMSGKGMLRQTPAFTSRHT